MSTRRGLAAPEVSWPAQSAGAEPPGVRNLLARVFTALETVTTRTT